MALADAADAAKAALFLAATTATHLLGGSQPTFSYSWSCVSGTAPLTTPRTARTTERRYSSLGAVRPPTLSRPLCQSTSLAPSSAKS